MIRLTIRELVWSMSNIVSIYDVLTRVPPFFSFLRIPLSPGWARLGQQDSSRCTRNLYVPTFERVDARVSTERKFHWSMTRTKHRASGRKLIDRSPQGRGCYFYSEKYLRIPFNTYRKASLLIRAFNFTRHMGLDTSGLYTRYSSVGRIVVYFRLAFYTPYYSSAMTTISSLPFPSFLPFIFFTRNASRIYSPNEKIQLTERNKLTNELHKAFPSHRRTPRRQLHDKLRQFRFRKRGGVLRVHFAPLIFTRE